VRGRDGLAAGEWISPSADSQVLWSSTFINRALEAPLFSTPHHLRAQLPPPPGKTKQSRAHTWNHVYGPADIKVKVVKPPAGASLARAVDTLSHHRRYKRTIGQ
jgi:hypothetical protein